MSNLEFEPDPRKRAPITHEIWPGAGAMTLTWVHWHAIMRDLEQKLSRNLRVYPGPSTDDDVPPEGGTPVLMRMAA